MAFMQGFCYGEKASWVDLDSAASALLKGVSIQIYRSFAAVIEKPTAEPFLCGRFR